MTNREKLEKLRQLFKGEGDYNPILEQMFGNAYLDHRDDSNEGIPLGLTKVAEESGLGVANISGLLKRGIEQTPRIPCLQNQYLLARYLTSMMREIGEGVDFSDFWAIEKHMDGCSNRTCRELYDITVQDKWLSPKSLEKLYGEIVTCW